MAKKASKVANVKKIAPKKVAKKTAPAKKVVAPKKKVGAAKPSAKVVAKSSTKAAVKPTNKPKVLAKKVVAKKGVAKKTTPKKQKAVVVTPPPVKATPAVAKQSQQQVQRNPKQKKIKQVFIPYNPIQPIASAGKSTKKEPKGKFELEYVIRCSEPLLFEFVSTPSGLSEWFSDDVNIRDGVYTFIWDGSEQKAHLLAIKEDIYIRFQWADKTDGSFFEFRIQTDELTGDVSLIIVDFAENEEERISSKLLWDAQIDKLMKTIGSHT